MSISEKSISAGLSDAAARERALDPEISCIVRAPAGSGKTELLIQRFLVMLARVDNPWEVLAITFTRKAAAEMRERVVGAISAAVSPAPPELSEHQCITRNLALAVLERDRRRQWNILQAPSQLRIQTIDSLNAELVRRMPWLSRLGALPRITELPQQYYQSAVRALLFTRRLDSSTRSAVEMLLQHVDNRADILENMLVDLLARRDQWMRHILDDPGQMRTALEQNLEFKIEEVLRQADASLDAGMKRELHNLGVYAAEHCADSSSPVCTYQGTEFPPPQATSLGQWQALASVLLTRQGQWRKRLDKNCGFPPGKDPQSKTMKQLAMKLIETLRDRGDSGVWHEVSELPRAHYRETAWEVLRAMLVVLPRLVAQLWMEFRTSSEADFTEIALSARQALVDSGNPTELLLQLDQQIEHILVDEFQDTSWLQFSLLETLTSAWDQSRGRTLFIVGDPMQSIYRFREAEVGLFLRAGSEGIGQIPLVPLQLQANFRSQKNVVELTNQWFSTIFPPHEHAGSGAVKFSRACPVIPAAGEALEFIAQSDADADAEARAVVERVKEILSSSADEDIAILVRSRSHLSSITALLQREAIAYQAQEIDPLKDNMLVRDAVSVLKTLLHPADKLSWMSVLRAPWCGLKLVDLTHVSRFSTLAAALNEAENIPFAEEGARIRFIHVAGILVRYQQLRGRMSVRRLCDECLAELQVHKCWSAQECETLCQFATVLERCEHGAEVENFSCLEEQLKQLYARAQGGPEVRLHVMTIHKAKGLEFDHVFLPGLGSRTGRSPRTMLRWEEDPNFGLLLAPIAGRGASDSDPVYAMLERMEKRKEEYESVRLLYVALTRARRKIYCYAHAPLNSDGEPSPQRGSLLQLLWPVCSGYFSSIRNASGDDEDSNVVQTTSVLKRLPLNSFPPYATSATETLLPQISATSSEHRPTSAVMRRSAVLGTVVHEYLACLSGDKSRQNPEHLHSLREEISRRFQLEGYVADADTLAQSCLQMLMRSIESETGTWILASHPQAAAEFEVCGMYDGETVVGVVDRTFVDATTGVRWIIDYKSALPENGEALDIFLERQRSMYAPQLERYIALMQRLEPDRRCRAGLYFPACDAWCEC